MQAVTPSKSETSPALRTIAALSYRTLIRSTSHDYLGYLNFTRVQMLSLPVPNSLLLRSHYCAIYFLKVAHTSIFLL